jgi:hypothetical protein
MQLLLQLRVCVLLLMMMLMMTMLTMMCVRPLIQLLRIKVLAASQRTQGCCCTLA